MKLPKSLIAAMAFGLAVSAGTSCKKIDLNKEFGKNESGQECGTTSNEGDNSPPDYGDCPMCGLG